MGQQWRCKYGCGATFDSLLASKVHAKYKCPKREGKKEKTPSKRVQKNRTPRGKDKRKRGGE